MTVFFVFFFSAMQRYTALVISARLLQGHGWQQTVFIMFLFSILFISIPWSQAESPLRINIKPIMLSGTTPVPAMWLVYFRCSKRLKHFVNKDFQDKVTALFFSQRKQVKTHHLKTKHPTGKSVERNGDNVSTLNLHVFSFFFIFSLGCHICLTGSS